ncbi:hypothetical protein [Simonsiella muelleri]|uniref:hypothetical protein n=1 Tax=Simonsiella muelleri TaxID=72 RepID=UPI0023F523AC|nr:hypothetical protein [Simonsiella muelleri]
MTKLNKLIATALISLFTSAAYADDLTPLFEGFKQGCTHSPEEFAFFKGLTGRNEDGSRVGKNTVQVPAQVKQHFVVPVKIKYSRNRATGGGRFQFSYVKLQNATFENMPIKEAGILVAYNNFSPYLVLGTPLTQAKSRLQGKLQSSTDDR